MISNDTRQRLRVILQSIEKADEIINAIDQASSVLMINRVISTTLTVPANYTMIQHNPVIQPGGNIIIQPGGELLNI